MLRVDLERKPALVAPPLQVDQAITLPRRVALGERLPTRLGKHVAEEDGLVVHFEIMPAHDLHEGRMADMGPRAHEREVVVDGAGHGAQLCRSGAGWQGAVAPWQGAVAPWQGAGAPPDGDLALIRLRAEEGEAWPMHRADQQGIPFPAEDNQPGRCRRSSTAANQRLRNGKNWRNHPETEGR
jgi:hypothetical protein